MTLANELYLCRQRSLTANQAGEVTDEQYRHALRLNLGSTIAMVLLGLAGLAVIWILIRNWQISAKLNPVVVIALAGFASLIILTAASYLIPFAVRMSLTRRDMATSEIQVADGFVIWRYHRYAAEFPNRAFWSNNTVTKLLPGPYRFYYLPLSGYILSAKPLRRMLVDTEIPSLNDVLRGVVGFNEADLVTNEAGRISRRQAARLILNQLRISAVLFAFGWLFSFGFSYLLSSAKSAATCTIIVAAGFAILAVIVLVRAGLDLVDGRVVQAEAIGSRKIYSPASGGRSYHLRVGAVDLLVSRRLYEAIVPGQVYRVYYAPRTEQVLALVSRLPRSKRPGAFEEADNHA